MSFLPKPASLHLVANAAKAPKPMKPPGLPKLKRITVTPASNGLHMAHQFHGLIPTKNFVFKDPAKARTHLDRAIRSVWREPNINTEARRVTSALDIQAG